MRDALKAYAWAIVATLVFAAMLFGLGVLVYQAGRTTERVVWIGVEKTRADAAATELKAAIRRGNEASKSLQGRLDALQTSFSTLEGQHRELSRRVPLVVPAAVRPRDAGCSPLAVPDAASAALAADAADLQAHPVGQRSYSLSRAAVWMWNSSLAGVDTPVQFPGGACGAADTSEQSCAPDAGVTVDDAWSNHHLNAKQWAADRERHRALIEFLTERPAP